PAHADRPQARVFDEALDLLVGGAIRAGVEKIGLLATQLRIREHVHAQAVERAEEMRVGDDFRNVRPGVHRWRAKVVRRVDEDLAVESFLVLAHEVDHGRRRNRDQDDLSARDGRVDRLCAVFLRRVAQAVRDLVACLFPRPAYCAADVPRPDDSNSHGQHYLNSGTWYSEHAGARGGSRIYALRAPMRASATVAVVLLLTACGGPTTTPLPSGGVHTPGPLGDTWTGDGTKWHQADGAGPAPRYSASLAFDPKHHNFVLFGGQTTRGSSDETWRWDAGNWTAMT